MISDASWYQFIQWVNCFAHIHGIVAITVSPQFTTQDCSNCGARVQESLSRRTHQCPNCKTVLDRDDQAVINVLKKGLERLGQYINGTVRHIGTDPNAWGECDLWTFKGNIESFSRFAEPGNPSGDAGGIPY